MSFNLEEALASARREGVRRCAADHATLTQQYLASCASIEQTLRSTEEQRTRNLQALQTLRESTTLNVNLVKRAYDFCKVDGDDPLHLDAVLNAFNRGKQTKELLSDLGALKVSILSKKASVVRFFLDNNVDYQKSAVDAFLTPYEEVFTMDLTTPEEHAIFEAMRSQILKDFSKFSKTGDLSFINKILNNTMIWDNTVANQFVNSPIPSLNGMTPIMVLARDNHLGGLIHINTAVRRGGCRIDYAMRDNSGKSILEHAFEGGHKTLVDWLLDEMPAGQLSELELACKQGNLDAVQQLLQQLGANPAEKNNAPLVWASLYGHTAVVNHLLSLPAGRIDVKARDNAAIIVAARYGYLEIVQRLTEHGAIISARDNAALALAKAANHQAIVVELERRQIALDHSLLKAVALNNRQAVEVALARGANINCIETSYRHCNPLQFAIVHNHIDLAVFLAQQPKVDMSYKTTGDLNMASFELARHYQLSCPNLDFGRVVNQISIHPNYRINITLLEAVLGNDLVGVQRAISAGASMSCVEPSAPHRNPLQLAIVCGHQELAEFLAKQPKINLAYRMLDDANMTSLELAVSKGYIAVKTLIEQHPEYSANNLLIHGAASGSLVEVNQALQSGADVQATDINGFNALQLSVLYHDTHRNAPQIAEPLVQKGIFLAYRSKRTARHDTAFEMASALELRQLAAKIEP